MLFEILKLFFFLVQFLVVLSPSGCFEILLPFSSQVKIWAISGMLGHSRVLWEHTTFFLARLGLWDFWLFLLSTSAWRVFQLFTRWSVPLWFHVVFGALKSVRDLATFSCNLQACPHYIFFFDHQSIFKGFKVANYLFPRRSFKNMTSDSLRFYHFFPSKSKFEHILVFWGPLGVSDNLQPLSSQVWSCANSGCFCSLTGLGDFSTFFSLSRPLRFLVVVAPKGTLRFWHLFAQLPRPVRFKKFFTPVAS